MTNEPRRQLDRRALLRNGTLALSFGAIAAACGAGRSGPTNPGRIGVIEPNPTLPPGDVNDVVLLRTAQSIEYTALAVYEAAAGLDVLSSDEAALVGRFVTDHERHAAAIGALVTQAGGEEFTCANPFIMERAVAPILGALDGSDDLHRDVLNIAHAFESLAGASYQAVVSSLEDLGLRRAAIVIGGEEQRHAAALAAAINPDELISPAVFAEPVVADDAGFPIPFAIPSTFGQLSGIELVVGEIQGDEGRFSVLLQTPAENTFVYDYLSC